MNAREITGAYLNRRNFPVGGPDLNGVIHSLLYDMEVSLGALPAIDTPLGGSQEMIPTWSMPPSKPPKDRTVIVIDAGGTNFRSCLVHFDADGVPSITKLEKCSMPGIEREYGKKEFFAKIAENLDHLKDDASRLDSIRIGFCFSYAMKITPSGDGEVISFSKEIKAREVIGSLVGASLSDALVERGWKRPEKITLLNDTTAALLAGAANEVDGRRYSSFVGVILGTGMNTAYIESGEIKKAAASGASVPKSQIVVCESGMFNKVQRSEFDLAFDATTNTPNRYVMEKMCSGGYLGPLACVMLKDAARDGLFSKPVSQSLLELKTLELRDMDQYFYGPFRAQTTLGAIAAKGSLDDYDRIYFLLDAIVERSARLTAAAIAASVIKSGQGASPALPVSVLCEGTTFYKTHNLQQRLRGYLNQVLTEQRSLYFEIVTLDNAITLGAAVAGLSG